MSLVIDTNILLYAANSSSERHMEAKEYVEGVRTSGELCLTWSILYEFLRVSTHPKVFANPLSPQAAQSFVHALSADPRVEILRETDNHARFMRTIIEESAPVYGNRYHDVHIAAVMLENGVRTIATCDRHFRMFPSIRLVDRWV